MLQSLFAADLMIHEEIRLFIVLHIAVPMLLFPASSGDGWAPLRQAVGPSKPCVELGTGSMLVGSGH